MTLVLDTSVLAAFVNPGDPDHPAARGLMVAAMEGAHGRLVTSELVLIEGLTLLNRRPGREAVSRQFAGLFVGAPGARSAVQPLRTGREQLGRALDLHFRHYARRLSMTDCLLAVLAMDLEAPVASFDRGFDGVVPRIEAP